MSQNVICIAGAHRSGTSMLTRLLHTCGLYLGAPQDLMPPAADNPDGFWENMRFVQLNDEALNAIGGAWDLPPEAGEKFNNERLVPIRAKAQLLIESLEAKPSWGWKDPRNCLTLPFWKALLPDLKVVVMVRNPLEVAYSMHERNGISYALSIRLWEIYNRRLLAYTNPKTRIIAHYQSFFEAPAVELQRLLAFSGLSQRNAHDAASLVTTGRRHTSFTLEQLLDAGVAEPVASLYRSLLKEASGGATAAKTNAEFQGTEPGLATLAGATSSIDLGVHEAENVRRELAARRGAEVEQRALALRIQAEEKLTTEVARRDGRIEELQAENLRLRSQEQLLHQLRLEHGKALGENEGLRQETNDLRERFTQTNSLLQATSVRLAEAESRAGSLTFRLRTQLQRVKRLLRFLEEAEGSAERLRNSRRWQIANAFGALTAWLRHRPPPGFGHLDNNLKKYQDWRKRHPDLAEIDAQYQSLRAETTPYSAQLIDSLGSPALTKLEPPPPPGPIEFQENADVQVSIIIPIYNQLRYTKSCLASIQQHSGTIPFEVIVVDDCSNDETQGVISKIRGLVYLRNEINSGFIASCNHGAAKARGRYLLFLNNDTTVTENWLSSLIDTFTYDPLAGLVGSKLIYPDGKLQEAGGIIWRDASGWNRGKFQNAQLPEFNYLCEVDYCSAASAAIPKELFVELGGFDEQYSPAYYEDTDLAFKVTQAGRKVLYQPLSVVVHFEGITGGTDTSSGTKKYQDVNRETFARKWSKALAAKPVNGDIEAWSAPKGNSRKVLVIDHHLPLKDRDSGSLRMFQILTIIQQLGHQVTFIPDNLADIPPYGDELRRRGVRVIHHPYLTSIRQYLQDHGETFDLVILSRCDFARKHIKDVRQFAPQAHLIFDTVDLHFLREERHAAVSEDSELKTKAIDKHRLEYELIDASDETWVVSPIEKQILQRERPEAKIEVVSNIVDIPGSATPFNLRRDILFIGSFKHTPNADAIVFFVREIFSLVLQSIPELRLYIIGEEAPPEVVALANECIIVTGYQHNVSAYFDNIKLSIAPLRFGAGVKGKINQSMAYGVPVVATPTAAEGMGLSDGSSVMIANEPAAFAQAVIALYQSEQLWNTISQNSIAHTRRCYSREVAREQIRRLLNSERDFARVAQAASWEVASL